MRFMAQASVTLALLSAGCAWAQAPRLPIEAFMSPPMFERATLSPDMSQVAVLVNRPGERTQLALVKFDDLNGTRLAAAVSDLDIISTHWLSPTRLVFETGQAHKLRDEPIATGLWLLDLTSGESKPLIADRPDHFISRNKSVFDKLLPWDWRLLRALKDGSEDLMLERAEWHSTGEFSHLVLGRFNTRSGKLSLVTQNVPANVWQWVVDSKGSPEACVTVSGANFGVHLFDAESRSWKLWRTGRRNIDAMPDPLARLAGGDLLVSTYEADGDTRVVQRLRTTAEGKGETLLNIPGYDWHGRVILDPHTHRLLGLGYEADAADTAWFDRDMKALQAEIDKQLPATVNHIGCADCLRDSRLLVRAASDRQPETIYVYDRAERKLSMLFRSRPSLRAADMAPREVLRITARDGLSLPMQLTRPLGATGPRPAVVLVHGGPWSRGNHWFWEGEAQFLANRGYLVIEPEFRGSTGYGARHEYLGRKQWGQAMQHDLADAAQWAIEKGLADPKRICIAGASYGGYATLMGLIRDPALFACGIDWVGVTDPAYMFSRSRTDVESIFKDNDLKLSVGDPVADAPLLAANAPVKLAAQLKRPLLMAYGAEDRRVEAQQGFDMKKALEAESYQGLEWVVYDNEGHGWRSLETNKDFWGRVERFLERHIGGALVKP